MNQRTEDYLGALQEHLTLRGVEPDRVGQHLEEIAGHLEQTNRSPIAEYGSPETLARDLAEAEGLTGSSAVRLVPALLASLVLLVAVTLLFAGDEPARLDGGRLTSLLVPAAIMAIAFSPTTATLRDWLRGVAPLDGPQQRRVLATVVLAPLAVVAVGIVAEVALGDVEIGIGSVRSWVAGLALLMPGLALLWLSVGHLSRRPTFRQGSPLRARTALRRVEVGTGPRSDRGIDWTRVVGLAALPGFIALLLLARLADGGWSTALEISAFAFAPLCVIALFVLRTRTDPLPTDRI